MSAGMDWSLGRMPLTFSICGERRACLVADVSNSVYYKYVKLNKFLVFKNTIAKCCR